MNIYWKQARNKDELISLNLDHLSKELVAKMWECSKIHIPEAAVVGDFSKGSGIFSDFMNTNKSCHIQMMELGTGQDILSQYSFLFLHQTLILYILPKCQNTTVVTKSGSKLLFLGGPTIFVPSDLFMDL